MYNILRPSSTKGDIFVETQSQRDSKYTVAEILSSMTNGVSSNYSGAEQTPSTTSHPAVSTIQTPLLTPTTLASIERDFIELSRSSGIDNSFIADSNCMPQDLSLSTGQRESGFVPPIVGLPIGSATSMAVKREYTDESSSDCSSSATGPTSAKRQRRVKVPQINPDTYLVANSRRPTGPRKLKLNDHLSEEDENKRLMRKERNKVAAAKCRQRRVDQTNELIGETEQLEEEKANLENEIQSLQQQAEQLEFYLQAHNRVCSQVNSSPIPVSIKTERPSSTETATCSSGLMFRSAASSTARPNSLPLSMSGGRAFGVISTTNNINSVTGVPITTPSSGLALLNFGLEHLAEGHTGLTPLTGVAVSLTGATPTSTPTNYSGAVHKNNSDSSSPENLSSPKLMAIL